METYCDRIRRAGASAVIEDPVVVGQDGCYRMCYVPHEHRNSGARLVLVSTTPGHTHVRLAARVTQQLLRAHTPGRVIQRENKRHVELGGQLVRPNLIRMLDHFGVPQLLGMPGAASLWDEGFEHLHPMALLPYATTRRGLAFDGPIEELLDTPLLRDTFETHFLTDVTRIRRDALYIALGRTAWAGLQQAVSRGLLTPQQLLGMMPVPARAGSMVRYFLRELAPQDLSPNDPVRHRTAWLDAAHDHILANVRRLLPASTPVRARAAAEPLHMA